MHGRDLSPVRLTFVGSGDAFGSGGRLQTCLLVESGDTRFAVDFGATSLVGLRRQSVDPNGIDAILLTHLHGDHCGGVPFFLLDAMLGAKRRTPLTILGPPSTGAHLAGLREVLFPGSRVMEPDFDLQIREIAAETATELLPGVRVTAAEARHTRETNPLAYRVDVHRRSLAFTGDGEWTERLAELVRGVDLLVAESYFYDKPVKWHLNYPDIARLEAKRIVLTHITRACFGTWTTLPRSAPRTAW